MYKLRLRETVTHQADAVWSARGGFDVYTSQPRHIVEEGAIEVDHVLELQLAEHIFSCAAHAHAPNVPIGAGRSGAVTRSISSTASPSFAIRQSEEQFRDALNSLPNLNCTSARVNAAKRGPWTAAVNRVRSDRLRDVTLEQLARQGRARWLVDDGTWHKIEREARHAYETLADSVRAADGLPATDAINNTILDELGETLTRLGVL